MGAWLRAPPRRMEGPAKSKWLREEGDADWLERGGRGNRLPKSGESSYATERIRAVHGSKFRGQDQVVQNATMIREKNVH